MTPRDQVHARIRGLYAVADAELGDPVAHGRALLAGGVRLLQLRCKGWPRDDVREAARALRAACREVRATFLLNDDPALAAEIDADGVHVGQTDGDGARVRAALGPGRILGRSTGSPAELAAAIDHADYVAFGPIFDTPRLSRPKPVRGVEGLAALRAAHPTLALPLVAIGGITPENVARVRAAGADAWAVIGALRGADPAALRALA